MTAKTVSSVQAKIVVAISLTFLAILLVSVFMTARSELKLAEKIATEKARDIGQAYFDGINTMMLTGNMEQKENLRSKLLAKGAVLDIRVVHADKYLEGLVSTPMPPSDDLDRRALGGATVSTTGESMGKPTVTYLAPIRASSNYLGTNCLSCHQVPEGTVIGAVRTTYSLTELNQEIQQNLLINAGINLLLFVLGIGLVLALLRNIVVSPLLRMRQTMHQIEQNADLGMRLEVDSKDEVGALAQAINGMLNRFRDSLTQVSDTSTRLSSAADNIASVSEQAAKGAGKQREETEVVVRFVSDLKAIASNVGGSASEAANASSEADSQAVQGTARTREAIGGILTLVQEIGRAAQTIEKLEDRSHSVSEVLAVIRGVAEQTNLLALNAAIEAARAGEMGRGFAVVADEVRKLATLSQNSTQNIEEIVSQLQSEAKESVDVMHHARASAEKHSQQLEQAVASLDQIVSQVADIRQLNQGMALEVVRQGEITENVNERMLNVSGIADRTADEAVQTRGISEELVALARELNGLVSRFKL